jgi:hypothetical protein
VIKSKAHVLKNKQLQVLSDNKNVKLILLNGSKILSIQNTALDLDIFVKIKVFSYVWNGFLGNAMNSQII